MNRTYNSALQTTSFDANKIRHGDFMLTFKVQGQVYQFNWVSFTKQSRQTKVFANIYHELFSERSIIVNVNSPKYLQRIIMRLAIFVTLSQLHVCSFKSAFEVMQSNIENMASNILQ